MINNYKAKDVVNSIILSILFIISVIPGFKFIGNLFVQIGLTVIVSLVIILLFDKLFKCKPVNFSVGLFFMTAFWISVAIIKQVSVHVQSDNVSLNWLHIFYFDRPMLLFIVYFTCILYFIVKLIFNLKSVSFVNAYSKFIKKSIVSFLIYYVIILIYSFIIVRKATFERPQVNLIPFEMIKFTFTRGYIDYELLFLFLGNIAIFLPLGIIVSALTKKKSIIIITPILISFLIELSQFCLGNGHPDIDDFILNIFGFFLGVGIKLFLDFLIYKASSGRIESFFIFENQVFNTNNNQK